MNNEIQNELRKPFHPSLIEFIPQATTKDGTKAMAAAYADLRAYQNRLDEVCGMDWSVTYTPWGNNRIVCHVTINGVTRSSTGESDSQSEKSEIGGTAMEAQAFKRACSMFGLGRYLYSLPSPWVELDPATKKFTAAAQAKLEGLIVQHYRRSLAGNVNQATGEITEVESTKKEESLQDKLQRIGKAFYKDAWATKLPILCETVSTGSVSQPDELSAIEIERLIAGIEKKLAEPVAVPY